jgi:hypothetical protein
LFGSDSVNQIETPAQKYAGVLILVLVIVAAANSICNPKISAVTSAADSSTQVLKTDKFSSQKICQEICQEKVKWV